MNGLQGYYFETEKSEKNSLWFAYVYREEDNAATAPPVKEFHSDNDGGDRIVSERAAEWIREHGVIVP